MLPLLPLVSHFYQIIARNNAWENLLPIILIHPEHFRIPRSEKADIFNIWRHVMIFSRFMQWEVGNVTCFSVLLTQNTPALFDRTLLWNDSYLIWFSRLDVHLYIRIITTITCLDTLYYVKWIFLDQNSSASSMMHTIWKYLRDMVHCVRSKYCIDNTCSLFYIFSSNAVPFLNIITRELTFLAACLITSLVLY